MFIVMMVAATAALNAQSQRISAIEFQTFATEMNQWQPSTDITPRSIHQSGIVNPEPEVLYIEPANLNQSDYELKEEVIQEEIVAGVIQEELNAGRKSNQNGFINLVNGFTNKIEQFITVLNRGRKS